MLGRKNGFTLIELIVVMAMIAILTLISVSALLSSRTQNTVDSMAQDILSNIRDAQNRSVSTVSGTAGPAKVWAYQIKFNSGTSSWDNSLYTYSEDRPPNGKLQGQIESTNTPFNPAATISIMKDGTLYNGDGKVVNIAFASPFGRPYISDGSNANNCRWQYLDSRPAKDWFIDSVCSNLSSPATATATSSPLTIVVSYGNMNRSVIVGASGDAYIQ